MSSSQTVGAAGAGRFVCACERRGRYLLARELFAPGRGGDGGRRSLRFALPRVGSRVGEGAIVVVELTRHGPRLVEELGHIWEPADVIEGLLRARGERRPFPKEAAAEIAKQRAAVGRGRGRVDLTALPAFTIDPVDAKDHDDAISARFEPDGALRVWVHIADVGAYVTSGSVLDREAQRRSTSVYVPGTVSPMLPEELANGLCSLQPGVERPAVTVELVVVEGRVVESAFSRSLIRSRARLHYDEVQEMLEGKRRPPQGLADSLAAARVAAAALADRRRERGALELESFEPQLRLEGGAVTATLKRSGGQGALDSRELIEQLMVAANEAVAARLAAAGVPTLYRVHPRPRPQRVVALRDQLATLELPTVPLPEPMSSEQAAQAVADLSRLLDRQLASFEGRGGGVALRLAVSALVLRALEQAFYSPRNIGHAGLASTAYCHFTSPIRRYPDLIAHRALLSTVGRGEPPRAVDLEALGRYSSERERQALEVEREGTAIARAFALSAALADGDDPGRPLAGAVVGLSEGAAFIAFGLAGDSLPPYEGVLPLRALRDQPLPRRLVDRSRRPFSLNPEGTVVVDLAGRPVVRLGQELAVTVSRIEPERGRVVLAAAGGPERQRLRR